MKKAAFLKEVAWLRKHFKPSMDWHVGKFWFGAIPQSLLGDFAVKVVDLERFEGAPDEGFWLQHDNNGFSRWETESGCCYAILQFLEKEKI